MRPARRRPWRSCRRGGSAASSCAVSASIAAQASPPAPAIWIDSSVRCWSSPTADSGAFDRGRQPVDLDISGRDLGDGRDRSRSSNHVGRARRGQVRELGRDDGVRVEGLGQGPTRRNWSRAQHGVMRRSQVLEVLDDPSTRRSTSKGSSRDRTKPLRSSDGPSWDTGGTGRAPGPTGSPTVVATPWRRAGTTPRPAPHGL